MRADFRLDARLIDESNAIIVVVPCCAVSMLCISHLMPLLFLPRRRDGVGFGGGCLHHCDYFTRISRLAAHLRILVGVVV